MPASSGQALEALGGGIRGLTSPQPLQKTMRAAHDRAQFNALIGGKLANRRL